MSWNFSVTGASRIEALTAFEKAVVSDENGPHIPFPESLVNAAHELAKGFVDGDVTINSYGHVGDDDKGNAGVVIYVK